MGGDIRRAHRLAPKGMPALPPALTVAHPVGVMHESAALGNATLTAASTVESRRLAKGRRPVAGSAQVRNIFMRNYGKPATQVRH